MPHLTVFYKALIFALPSPVTDGVAEKGERQIVGWKGSDPQSGRLQQECRNVQRSHPSCSAFTPATFQHRLPPPNSPQHFASLVCKVENRGPSREKHGRAFLEKRFPKKKARQLSRTFQGGIIPWRPQIKYLVNPRVNWRAYIHRVLDRGREISRTLYPLLIGRGKLHLSSKIRIYRTAATTHMNKLQAFPSRILRMALNAPWFVRNTTLLEDAGVESLIDFCRRIPIRFFDRAVDHWSSHVSASQDYDPRVPWRQKNLKRGLKSQQSLFTKINTELEAATRASSRVAHEIAKGGKSFTDGEMIKECVIAVA
ncbi:hypothetical protein Trydic_g20060 [Trypoxylus dichotomus]